MKIPATLITFLLMVFFVSGIVAQDQKPNKQNQLYKDGVYNPYEVLDTRIDNMRYWKKAAELGLTPVAPQVEIPKGVFKGSKISAKSVWREDSPDVPVTNENSTQSENSIFVDPTDPDHVLQSNNSTQNPVGSLYGANYFFSEDFGLTWGGSVQGAGGSNSGDPATAIGLEGRQYVGFIHSNGGQGVSYSNDGLNWTSVLCGNPPGGWNILDKNHMWIDNSPSSPYEGNVYVSWLAFGNSNADDIEFVRSTDDGLSYSPHMNISSAINAGSHNQGVNIQTGPDGQVYAAWAVYDSWPSDETAIGFARSFDGGASFEPAERIITNIKGIRNSETSKNQRVNSFPVMTVDISGSDMDGNIYVVWTNIGVPGTNTGQDRDIYMISSEDEGESWSEPIRINQDEIGQGNEHYFPWISCDPETGALSAVFYDDRNVGGNKCEVFCANSFDGGDTWEDFRVSDVDFTPAPIPGLAGGYMGDYLGISARGGRVYPVWTDNRDGVTMTYTSPYETNSLPRPTDLIGSVTFETGEVQLEWVFETVTGFQHFIVYRDGFEIGTTVDNTFVDNLPDYGIYKYKVTAMHDDGESSGPSVTLQWGDAHVVVDPAQILESLDPGTTSIRYLEIENVGELDLIYEVSSSTEPLRGNQYCDASTNTEDEWIANVMCGDIDNSSSWQGGVADYTDQFTTIEVGMSEGITISNGNAWASDIVTVWVDWNDDYEFGVGTDEEFLLDNVGGQGETFTGEITVPQGTVSGDHRMRVRMTYSSPPEPCGSSSYGEVEDYTINVTGWLLVGRVVDTIAPGSYHTVEIEFNAEDLTQGTYYGNIQVESNDPDMPVVDIPVTLSVGGVLPLSLQALATPSDICTGESSQLEALAAGGLGAYTYEWTSDPAGFTSTLPDPMVYPEETTTYIVEVDDGENTISDQVTVNVMQMPEIPEMPEGETDLCLGVYQTVYMTNGSTGSDTYYWMISPEEAGTIDGTGLTATVTWDEDFTGMVSVMVAGMNDCGEGDMSDELEVTIHELPVVNLGDDIIACANWTIVLDAGNPGATYMWSSGETTQTIEVDTTGVGIGTMDVWVEVIDDYACTNTDTLTIQWDDCTGISESAEGWSVNVFPNPSDGEFSIEVSSRNLRPVQIKIYSSLGAVVYSENDHATGNIINLKNFREGIYYLSVKGDGINLIKKIVIQK
nr:T9SS type A sorting domain-containing protein [Bacteroidota bacterium]